MAFPLPETGAFGVSFRVAEADPFVCWAISHSAMRSAQRRADSGERAAVSVNSAVSEILGRGVDSSELTPETVVPLVRGMYLEGSYVRQNGATHDVPPSASGSS